MEQKQLFGVLGEHLAHTFSPQIHRFLGSYEYRVFEVAKIKLDDFFKRGDFTGLNITIPYKKDVMKYCDTLSDRAGKIGSVNTIVRTPDGKLFGDNTDYFGFKSLLDVNGIIPEGKKCLVLGSGGASRAVTAVLSDCHASSVTVISRSGENNYNNLFLHADADIIVNATPVGMYPNCEKTPVDPLKFPKLCAAVDLIYNPARTLFTQTAAEAGVKAVTGLYMLVAQAAESSFLFTGQKQSAKQIKKITDRVERDMKNIVLVGMPGCGKSTAGRALSALCGREFFDTDEKIENRTGKSPAVLISEYGEEYFRNIETEVLRELCFRSAAVIATGGGIVKLRENRALLRRNSTVVFMHRETARLAVDGRPLSHNLEAMYAERKPLYMECADIETDVSDNPDETAKRIYRAVYSDEL